MRIIASLMLAIAASGVPVWAMDYQPVAAPSVSARDSGVRLVGTTPENGGTKALTMRARHYNVHRRAVRPNTPILPTGFLITDFKPDGHHLYASQNYLPPKTDDLTFAETNVAPVKLHKVSPSSFVASLKYQF